MSRIGVARVVVLTVLSALLGASAMAQTVVHSQGFNTSLSPWTEVLPSQTTADWDVTSSGSYPSCSPREGAKMAWFNSYTATSSDYAWMYSPSLDLTAAEVVTLRFWMYQDNNYSSYNDRIVVLQSTDGDIFYPVVQYSRYNATTGWVERVVHLGYYAGRSQFWIGLEGISANGNNIFVDDLSVTKQILPARADGKDCQSGADCDSGICGVDPGGARRCRPAASACIDGNRQGVASGTTVCYGPDRATCTAADTWSVTNCANDCGPYADVHACGLAQCIECEESCDPFFDSGCDANAYCAFNPFPFPQCFYKKADGQSCTENKQCTSNNCVSAPSGSKFCEPAGTRCAGTDGSAVAVGQSTCYNNDRYTCQSTGWQATDCAQNCGFYVDVDSCVGGACTACATSCTSNDDCKTGILCQNNRCVGDLPNGSTCQLDTQCLSRHCIDGRCCQDICSARCFRCDITSDGVCRAIPAGQDPDNECTGEGLCKGTCNGQGACAFPAVGTVCQTCVRCDGLGFCRQYVPAQTDPQDECPQCQACNGSGPGCAPISAGQDPLDECPALPEASCSFSGACDGSGQCEKWPTHTECGPGSCVNGNAVLPATCDGAGTCLAGSPMNCGLYRCQDSTRCASSCSSHAHCVSEAFCSAAGQCQPDQSEGASCEDVYPGQVGDAACLGGFCLRDNFDGQGAFCSSNPAGCVHDGAYFPPGYVLCSPQNAAAVCLGGARGWGPLQDCGSGTCDAGGGPSSGIRAGGACLNGPGGGCTSDCISCEPYQAESGTACRTTCRDANDCWSGYACESGTCRVPEGIGDVCSSQSGCVHGLCVDGRCCVSACTGLCRSCAVDGRFGFCAFFPAGTDPDNECEARPASTCGTTGACDGTGACALWPAGEACSPARCEGNLALGAGSCNGAGDCVPGSQQDCFPGVCVQAACRDTCVAHAECATGAYCGVDGRCHARLPDGERCTGMAYPGQPAGGVCQSGFCTADTFEGSGEFCASTSDACVAAGASYPPGYRLCRGDSGYRICAGRDGFGELVSCQGAGLCDAGSGPATGITPAETCLSGIQGGCRSTCLSCHPFMAAGPGVCRDTCQEDAHCWPGYFCQGGACQRANGLGEACATDGDCAGFSCVDQVCCNLPCQGPCRTCADPLRRGACSVVAGGTDPGNDCDVGAAACGPTGLCDDRGSCAMASAGTSCAPATCRDGVRIGESYCDDAGECQEGPHEACPSGRCDGDRCAEAGDGGDGYDGGVFDDPVAEAGPVQYVKVGTQVTLDGSQSFDPLGDTLSFAWSQTSGPETVELAGATTARPSFTARKEGVYGFRLVVRTVRATSQPDVTEVRAGGAAESCGCGSASAGGAAGPLLLLLIGLRRRQP
ncbi:MAG: hypothetical protein GYA21_01415 [Myxococcales bacterium]|nr:hypothetical protein [Myxococcales bacterium]